MNPGLLILIGVLLTLPSWRLTRESNTDREYVLGAALAALGLTAACLAWLIELGYV